MDVDALNTFLRCQIRRTRQEKGLSLSRVAELAGLPISSYSSLETGAYRFTIATLYKVLSALQVDIAEIWPPFWKAKLDLSLDRLKEVDQLNWFRMREIYLRSVADSLCLVLSFRESVEFLGWINFPDKDRALLARFFLSKAGDLEKHEWQVFSRSRGERRLCLCLRRATVAPYLAELIGQYLLIWEVSRTF
ncbi:MAG: XRE family transcriptional regulator [Acidobacteria bacterium]|nr:MAG: XRE family transcriptional regulator [Acidobacteriota bacterium]